MTETYQTGSWNLEELFSSPESKEVESAIKQLETFAEDFEGWREKLTPDMGYEDFMDCLDLQEKNTRVIARLFQYSYLNFSGDTQDQNAQAFVAKIQQFGADLENQTLFFGLWWKALDSEAADRLMKDTGDFEYWLRNMRNFKPYTLTEPEEKIINVKNVTGSNALQNLYTSITNRYVYKLEVDGEEKEMTRGELMSHVQSPDADLRARAYQKLYQVYGDDGPILGQIYQSFVKDFHNENVKLRGMKSTISARNLANDLPDEVVETLMDVAQKNSGIFQKYFKLKAKWLKVDKLRRYDIYAPVAKADKKYSYDEAVNMVLESFREFDPDFENLAKQVFEKEHIDSKVVKGKMGGAYNYGADPALLPYVLINYNDQPRDVATLAHELGHSLHSILASEHNIFASGSSLPLAETASTFAEMVLTDKLLAEEKDAGVRRDILFAQMDDAFATILRQIFFALFEREAHDLSMKGATIDEMNAAYLKNLETQFGDAVEISEEFKWEWVSIPHIYDRPFYVYAYAFGQLLVMALYQQFKKEGAPFVPRYQELLSAGTSMSPMNILDRAGVDVRKAEFWQGGFDVIAEMLEKLESIPVE